MSDHTQATESAQGKAEPNQTAACSLQQAVQQGDVFLDEKTPKQKATETGGPQGPEPTRYGDWERGGIVSDF